MRHVHFNMLIEGYHESILPKGDIVGWYTDDSQTSGDIRTALGLIKEINIKPHMERFYGYTISGYVVHDHTTVSMKSGVETIFDNLQHALEHLFNSQCKDAMFVKDIIEYEFRDGTVRSTDKYSVIEEDTFHDDLNFTDWTLLKNGEVIPWPDETESDFETRIAMAKGNVPPVKMISTNPSHSLETEHWFDTAYTSSRYMHAVPIRARFKESDKNIGRFLREHFPENYARLSSWVEKEHSA